MPSKITTIKRIRVLGDFMMFGIFVCLLIIFLHAYINGMLNGNYTTIVDINSQNEAHVEFILLLVILMPVFIMTTIWSFLDWKATWKARDNVRLSQYYFEPESITPRNVETILMRCSACHEMFGVTAVEDNMKIECPHCRKVGRIKLPSKKSGKSAVDTKMHGRIKYDDAGRRHSDDDTGKGPKVRIIKDIRDH
jgi:phage FluMu protein Com